MKIQQEDELCFPQLLNASCRKPKLVWSRAVLLSVLPSFISLTTVVLNLLVIISVSHFRQLHTPTNILILSLAVSDLLVGFLLIPGEVVMTTSCWFFGDIICSLYQYLLSHILCASVGSIILISVDRYVAICHPMQYPVRVTTTNAKHCVSLCWLTSGLFSVYYVKDALLHPGISNSCTGECIRALDQATGIVDLVFGFVFSVTLVVVLYLRVFVVAVSQARSMCAHISAAAVPHPGKVKVKRSELKAARTLGVLVCVFLMCYCPYYCYSLVEVKYTSTYVAYFFFVLFYFNSCLNPLIYALFYPWFRKSIHVIITLHILRHDSCGTNVL